MTFDMNDAEPQGTGELIPNGTFAKVTMTIRRGGSDGESEIDRGLLKESNSPGSDVKSLDTEFTVTEGPYARRKFWQLFTVSGGKVDDNGVPSTNPRYGDSNKLGRVVVPTEPEWRRVLNGEVVPPAPGTRSRPKAASPAVATQSWNQSVSAPGPAPIWNHPPAATAAQAPEPAPAASPSGGPQWLNG